MCRYIGITVVVLCCQVVSVFAAQDDLNTTVAKLQISYERLDLVVQEKNDEVQSLQERVTKLEKGLTDEKNRTSALGARVEALENQTKSKTEELENVKKDLASATATIQQLTQELEHQTHRLNNTKDKANSEAARVNQEIAQLTTNITNVLAIANNATNTVNNFKPTTIIQSNWNRTEVYFSFRDALNTSLHIEGASPDPLPFDTKISMSDDHPFHKHQGIFTAPVDGLYSFTATLSATVVDNFLKCYIMRDGTDYLVELYISSDGIDSSTGSVVVELTKGQEITISKCKGTGDIDSYKTSFSGFLINKLFD